PEKTPDFECFHPTSIMETGADILFFWVARMVMSSLEFVGEIPFHTIYYFLEFVAVVKKPLRRI
ncbi:MAG: class I tRNA ligase family protein, partial [Deltaproteobacteria bacterium]|nr:class I tRNA ligase family protein [Deltaproteobacteria bacterium]